MIIDGESKKFVAATKQANDPNSETYGDRVDGRAGLKDCPRLPGEQG